MAAPVITRTARRWIVVGALTALIALVAGIALVGGGSDEEPAEAATPVPEVEFELFEGGTSSFADFRGQPLVVNFWASWCPACVAELPEFEKVHQDVSGEVRFLGLANADLRGPAEDLAEEVGLTYTLADDPQGDVFRQLGLLAMPSTVFVDADGDVVEVFSGQLDEAGLQERIDRLREAS